MTPSLTRTVATVALLLCRLTGVQAWSGPAFNKPPLDITKTFTSNNNMLSEQSALPNDIANTAIASRRQVLLALPILTSLIGTAYPALAADSPTSTTDATITDRIVINVKGLPGTTEPQRMVIGLFGKEAPNSVTKLKQLVTTGLEAACRPKAERVLQKEQLEANKVYNSCIEGQEEGVSLRYSSIWRVVPNERIDLGDVRGKFVAREYPDWQESSVSQLKHDMPGVVSVRRGNEGGFGFTVYPGGDASQLDADHIVVGRVIEGMDIVKALNEVPVISSAKINYMALTGGPTTKNAPTRACRYGGPMYCNENKPLVKLSISDAGVL
jgi:cyclophilin family peptidyl-prolyl cis-trans isomerase